MQLAGKSCAICSGNVLLASEATWCARCSSILHSKCIAAAQLVCPVCHREYERPEAHFVRSVQCPICLRANEPSGPRCKSCGAGTQWDNQTDYEDFVAHMKDEARIRALRGFAELLGAGLCLLLFLTLAEVRIRIGVGPVFICFMIAVFDGIRCLRKSWQWARFR